MSGADESSERSMQPFWWDIVKVTPLLAAMAVGSWWYFDTSLETGAFSLLGGLATYTLIELYLSKETETNES